MDFTKDIITKQEIVQKLEITELEPEQQDEIVSGVIDTINNRLLNRIYDRLNDQELNELNNLIDQDEDGPIEWFIKSKFENYDDFARLVAFEYLEELKESLRPVLDSLNNPQTLSSDPNSPTL